MQLMCPSCCGGLFSDPKGSVYMKRAKSFHSETGTVATEIGEDRDANGQTDVNDDNKGEGGAEIDKTNTGACSLIHKQPSPLPSPSTNATTTGAEIDGHVGVDGDGKEDGECDAHSTKSGDVVYFTHRCSPSTDAANRRKKLTSETVEEEFGLFSRNDPTRKSRSTSLGDVISNALGQELAPNDTADGESNWQHKLLKKTGVDPNDTNRTQCPETEIELRISGKEPVKIKKQGSENEPPFNFQAMLRKTNSTRGSLRRTSEDGLNGIAGKHSSTEILPGVILEGEEYDV